MIDVSKFKWKKPDSLTSQSRRCACPSALDRICVLRLKPEREKSFFILSVHNRDVMNTVHNRSFVAMLTNNGYAREIFFNGTPKCATDVNLNLVNFLTQFEVVSYFEELAVSSFKSRREARLYCQENKSFVMFDMLDYQSNDEITQQHFKQDIKEGKHRWWCVPKHADTFIESLGL